MLASCSASECSGVRSARFLLVRARARILGMPQKTLVVRVAPEEGARLQRRLDGEPFEFRAVPHARFSAKGLGVVATYYASGKLVVQGEDPDTFVARFLGREAEPLAPKP